MSDKRFIESIPGARYTVRSKAPGESMHAYVGAATNLGNAEVFINREQALHPERDYYITEERIVGHREPIRGPLFASPRHALEQAVSLLLSCTDDEFDDDGWALVDRLRTYLQSL